MTHPVGTRVRYNGKCVHEPEISHPFKGLEATILDHAGGMASDCSVKLHATKDQLLAAGVSNWELESHFRLSGLGWEQEDLDLVGWQGVTLDDFCCEAYFCELEVVA